MIWNTIWALLFGGWTVWNVIGLMRHYRCSAGTEHSSLSCGHRWLLLLCSALLTIMEIAAICEGC